MRLSILLVEDNSHKREKLTSFLKENYLDCEIDEAYSFTSGSQMILKKNYNLAILDMSLPTYDKTKNESGGRFRTFGGREVARKMVRKKLKTKIIFITQYASFSEQGRSQTLEEIKIELQQEYGENYIGTVYYDSSQSAWKDKFIDMMGKTQCAF